jgi:succinyl-CoA synthetase beta subunit
LIKFANKDNVKEVVSAMQEEVLIEEKLAIEEEHYLSVSVGKGGYLCVASSKGGVNIEDVPSEDIVKGTFDEVKDKVCAGKRKLLEKLIKIAKDKDAILVEINPLVLVDHKLYAADAKVIIDDNALFRQSFEGSKEGGNYVELDGNIGVIGNGAGLVMSTLDVLGHYGGKAANFLDVGGGASKEVMKESLDKVLANSKVEKLLINVFGGITRCDEIAKGLVEYGIKVPTFVRLVGTNEEEGKKVLSENSIKVFDSMEDAVKAVVSA